MLSSDNVKRRTSGSPKDRQKSAGSSVSGLMEKLFNVSSPSKASESTVSSRASSTKGDDPNSQTDLLNALLHGVSEENIMSIERSQAQVSDNAIKKENSNAEASTKQDNTQDLLSFLNSMSTPSAKPRKSVSQSESFKSVSSLQSSSSLNDSADTNSERISNEDLMATLISTESIRNNQTRPTAKFDTDRSQKSDISSNTAKETDGFDNLNSDDKNYNEFNNMLQGLGMVPGMSAPCGATPKKEVPLIFNQQNPFGQLIASSPLNKQAYLSSSKNQQHQDSQESVKASEMNSKLYSLETESVAENTASPTKEGMRSANVSVDVEEVEPKRKPSPAKGKKQSNQLYHNGTKPNITSKSNDSSQPLVVDDRFGPLIVDAIAIDDVLSIYRPATATSEKRFQKDLSEEPSSARGTKADSFEDGSKFEYFKERRSLSVDRTSSLFGTEERINPQYSLISFVNKQRTIFQISTEKGSRYVDIFHPTALQFFDGPVEKYCLDSKAETLATVQGGFVQLWSLLAEDLPNSEPVWQLSLSNYGSFRVLDFAFLEPQLTGKHCMLLLLNDYQKTRLSIIDISLAQEIQSLVFQDLKGSVKYAMSPDTGHIAVSFVKEPEIFLFKCGQTDPPPKANGSLLGELMKESNAHVIQPIGMADPAKAPKALPLISCIRMDQKLIRTGGEFSEIVLKPLQLKQEYEIELLCQQQRIGSEPSDTLSFKISAQRERDALKSFKKSTMFTSVSNQNSISLQKPANVPIRSNEVSSRVNGSSEQRQMDLNSVLYELRDLMTQLKEKMLQNGNNSDEKIMDMIGSKFSTLIKEAINESKIQLDDVKVYSEIQKLVDTVSNYLLKHANTDQSENIEKVLRSVASLTSQVKELRSKINSQKPGIMLENATEIVLENIRNTNSIIKSELSNTKPVEQTKESEKTKQAKEAESTSATTAAALASAEREKLLEKNKNLKENMKCLVAKLEKMKVEIQVLKGGGAKNESNAQRTTNEPNKENIGNLPSENGAKEKSEVQSKPKQESVNAHVPVETNAKNTEPYENSVGNATSNEVNKLLNTSEYEKAILLICQSAWSDFDALTRYSAKTVLSKCKQSVILVLCLKIVTDTLVPFEQRTSWLKKLTWLHQALLSLDIEREDILNVAHSACERISSALRQDAVKIRGSDADILIQRKYANILHYLQDVHGQ